MSDQTLKSNLLPGKAQNGKVFLQTRKPSTIQIARDTKLSSQKPVKAHGGSLENYMTIQTDVYPKMWSILINWLIEVHMKFELIPETPYLMVELLDRFFSKHVIKKDDMISISADMYTRDQMLAMEKFILKKLKFHLNASTPYVFMKWFLKAAQVDAKLEHLSFFLVELCLVEYEALEFRSSLLRASAIYIARCTLQYDKKNLDDGLVKAIIEVVLVVYLRIITIVFHDGVGVCNWLFI